TEYTFVVNKSTFNSIMDHTTTPYEKDTHAHNLGLQHTGVGHEENEHNGKISVLKKVKAKAKKIKDTITGHGGHGHNHDEDDDDDDNEMDTNPDVHGGHGHNHDEDDDDDNEMDTNPDVHGGAAGI
ncbi:hypothetical protein KSS87_010000, partial [Heliosperma pusillum]